MSFPIISSGSKDMELTAEEMLGILFSLGKKPGILQRCRDMLMYIDLARMEGAEPCFICGGIAEYQETYVSIDAETHEDGCLFVELMQELWGELYPGEDAYDAAETL